VNKVAETFFNAHITFVLLYMSSKTADLYDISVMVDTIRMHKMYFNIFTCRNL
jgi:hypothetical protein